MACRIFKKIAGKGQVSQAVQARFGHTMRGIDPLKARTLADRMAEMNKVDPALDFKVDIGFTVEKRRKNRLTEEWAKEMQAHRHDPVLEKKAREQQLQVSLDRVRDIWEKIDGPVHMKRIAEHYGIFQDLFGDAYFYPVLPLNIEYEFEPETVAKVYTGNVIKPTEAAKKPTVTYNAKDDALHTLVLTTPDGSMVNSKNEVCHWFIGNIPGSKIEKGEQLVDYLRPIPMKGVGYYRYVFVLYKQEKRIDYSEYKKPEPCLDLESRDWNTYEFYRKYQEQLTPCGVAFFQSNWDESVRDFYHKTLDLAEPIFQYDFPKPYIKPQTWFPLKEPFNLYMDKYKDPRDVRKRYFLKKLKDVHPFRPPKPPLKFPNAHRFEGYIPTWLKFEIMKDRLGWGRINDIN